MTPASAALGRVSAGYLRPAPGAADEIWCRLAAQGRVVARLDDGEAEPYRVHLTLLEHPALPAAQCYAVFGMGGGTLSVYRCLPADARLALRDPGAFNL